MRRRARFHAAHEELALRMEASVDQESHAPNLYLLSSSSAAGGTSCTQPARGLRPDHRGDRAFLVRPATRAQRFVRAKAIIRYKAIPYEVPASQQLPARLRAALQVVYRYSTRAIQRKATRAELSREAIRLGRLLLELLSDPEVKGLLRLMLLHESRRPARSS